MGISTHFLSRLLLLVVFTLMGCKGVMEFEVLEDPFASPRPSPSPWGSPSPQASPTGSPTPTPTPTPVPAPVLTSVSISNANPTNSTTMTLTHGTVTGAFTSYCLLVNDTLLSNCGWVAATTLPSSYVVSVGDGSKAISVWVKNADGSISNRVTSNAVDLDTTAPVFTVTPSATSYVHLSTGSTQSFTASVSNDSSPLYQWLLDGTNITYATSAGYTIDSSTLTGGNHSLQLRVSDLAGNQTLHTISVRKNRLPVIGAYGPLETIVQKINIFDSLFFSVPVTDADTDTLTFTWSLDNDSAHPRLTIPDPQEGPNYISDAELHPVGDTTIEGRRTIKFVVSDGYESVEKQWKVDINHFSSQCNGLTPGHICTLVGEPGIGNGIHVTASETVNQNKIKLLPQGVAVENVSGVDNLVLSDTANHVIWYYNRSSSALSRFGKSVPAYSAVIVAGNGQPGHLLTATETKLNAPSNLALDTSVAGSPALYIADTGNNRVLKLGASGTLTSVLGNGAMTPASNSSPVFGSSVACGRPWGLGLDSAGGKLYVSCNFNNSVRVLDLGTLQTSMIVDAAVSPETVDGLAGVAGSARTFSPRGLRVDSIGRVYWVEGCGGVYQGGVVRVYSPSAGFSILGSTVNAGSIATITGTSDLANGCSDRTGAAAVTRLANPVDLELDTNGFWIANENIGTTGKRLMFVRSISGATYLNTPVTTNTSAWMPNAVSEPYTLSAIALSGTKLFIADASLKKARSLNLLDSAPNVTHHLGSGDWRNGSSTDGVNHLPADVRLNGPTGLAIKQAPGTGGELYYSDTSNRRIRRVDLATGKMITYAGKATGVFNNEDDPKLDAGLMPGALAATYNGLIYADRPLSLATPNQACQVRLINQSGSTNSFFGESILSQSVRTVAGNYSMGCVDHTSSAYSGIDATSSGMYPVESLAVAMDAGDNPVLYASVSMSHCIVRIGPTGQMSVAVGDCTVPGNFDGALGASLLNTPKGITVDPLNVMNLFIVDQTTQINSELRYANLSSNIVQIGGVYVSPGAIATIKSFGGSPYLNEIAAIESQVCISAGSAQGNLGDHNIRCINRTTGASTFTCGPAAGSNIRAGSPLGIEQEGMSCEFARFSHPKNLAFDVDGNLYVSDHGNHILRMIKRWW